MSIPVLVLGFDDSERLKERIFELRRIGYRDIFVSLDGKPLNLGDFRFYACEQTQEMARQLEQDGLIKHLRIQESQTGQGKAIPSGISWFFQQVNFGLILEDDCELSPYAFDYLNSIGDALQVLKNPFVCCLSNLFPISHQSDREPAFSTIKSRFFKSWGWATTSATWNLFCSYKLSPDSARLAVANVSELSKVSKFLLRKNWSDQVNRILNLKQNTWALPFTLFVLQYEIAVHTPAQNMIKHHADSGAVHVKRNPKWYENIFNSNFREVERGSFLAGCDSRYNLLEIKSSAHDLYGASITRAIQGFILELPLRLKTFIIKTI